MILFVIYSPLHSQLCRKQLNQLVNSITIHKHILLMYCQHRLFRTIILLKSALLLLLNK